MTFGLPPSLLGKADASIALRSLLRRFAAAYNPVVGHASKRDSPGIATLGSVAHYTARRGAGSLRSVYVGEGRGLIWDIQHDSVTNGKHFCRVAAVHKYYVVATFSCCISV